MIKKCLGCGITLQSKSPYTLGYTPDMEKDYCERCFKITHYNAKIDADIKINNKELLARINSKGGFVFFLVDFLNIYEEVIDLFKSIELPKMLVITKADVIPKNIIKDKLLKKVKKLYDIKEDIIFSSVKTKENLDYLKNIIKDKKQVFFVGLTNSGKSSLINHLIGANITVSKNCNTTLDFIPMHFDNFTIIDAPGFVSSSFIDGMSPKGIVKPLSYQLKNKYYLKFLNINLNMDIDNNLTMYINNNVKVEKRRCDDDFKNQLKVNNNVDFIIKGLGFINVKKGCLINFNIPRELIEVRESIVGGSNE